MEDPIEEYNSPKYLEIQYEQICDRPEKKTVSITEPNQQNSTSPTPEGIIPGENEIVKLKQRMSETGVSVNSEDFYNSYLNKSHNGGSVEMEIHPEILDALEQYDKKYRDENSYINCRSIAHRSNQDLTKLVIQRVANDDLLAVIGRTTTNLKYLDISCSPQVTNEGIKHLFVKSAKENSSLYLMSSWIHKNLNIMNKIVLTLEYFDYSYTSANFYSRRLVNLFPGSYVFQRIFRIGENDYFGHHIFYRRNPDLALSSKGVDKNNDFEIQLRLVVGPKGASHFTKFLDHHLGWKNSYVVIRDEDKCRKIPIKYKQPISGVVTASKEEKRIYGYVTFEGGQLSSLYSLFPLDMTVVGECCPTLQTLTGIVYNTWKKKSYFLPNLIKIDAIAEPSTIISIFQSCPTLKFIKLRVKDGTLCDEDIVKSVNNSLSCRNLKEICILPGFFRPNQVHKTCPSPIRKQSDIFSHYNNNYCYSIPTKRERASCGMANPKKPSTINEACLIDGIELKKNLEREIGDNSCKLSLETAQLLISSCPNLMRLGNLAWWANFSEEDFESLKDQVSKVETENNCHLFLEWDSILLPHLDVASSWDH